MSLFLNSGLQSELLMFYAVSHEGHSHNDENFWKRNGTIRFLSNPHVSNSEHCKTNKL